LKFLKNIINFFWRHQEFFILAIILLITFAYNRSSHQVCIIQIYLKKLIKQNHLLTPIKIWKFLSTFISLLMNILTVYNIKSLVVFKFFLISLVIIIIVMVYSILLIISSVSLSFIRLMFPRFPYFLSLHSVHFINIRNRIYSLILLLFRVIQNI